MQATTWERECLFKDLNNYWCMETTSPMLKAGWEISQTADTTYWNYQIKPYLETQLTVTSDFLLKRLVSMITTIAMPKFKTSTFFSTTFGTSGQICYGFGWGSDAVSLKVSMQYRFVNCYKKILTDISDWSDTWTGKDAKWVDACVDSDDGTAITLKEWALTQAISSNAVLGGTAINGPGCFLFANWTAWAPYYTNLIKNGLAQMGLPIHDLIPGQTHSTQAEYDIIG